MTDNLSPIKRAIIEIRELRDQLDAIESAKREPIAIVGVGLRFPGGAIDPDSFWTLLRDGVDAITPIPEGRWDIDAYYSEDPDAPGKMTVKAGGFLQNVDLFDPAFFGINPREAQSMDPQQRLLLECAWEALERAGQAPDKLLGSQTGVFVGIGNSDYGRMIWNNPDDIDVYYATGTSYSVAAGRLSYLLGLQGPAVSIDTACSSSLVALHLAVQSLRERECDLALVGGVNVILTPELNIDFSKAGMMAADDHCKTFDAEADGYVRGEGCAVIAVKRLSDALANHDPILALVRGSAVNQDGRSSGLTAPNGPSQEAVIRKALENAGVEAADMNYVEAHGTGTSLGDPIEVQALGAVLGDANHPLKIGSVKTNIGHTEAAAGLAGLVKAVLALQHEQIPPHLNLNTLSPYIAWDSLGVSVPTALTDWPRGERARLASVSSFGFSGTNAHVILEESPLSIAGAQHVAPLQERPLNLVTLSARTAESLADLAGAWADALIAQPDLSATHVAYTANTGRATFNHRLAILADSTAQLHERLAEFAAAPSKEGDGWLSGYAEGTPEVAFLFSGQGSQYIGMGRQLYETSPVFRAALDAAAEAVQPHLPRPLLDVMFEDAADFAKMTYAQPAIFAIQYALAKLWISWGVQPTAVLGHSIGEYAAACIAGLFSLEDGILLAATRGRLMDSLPNAGEMVTVFADEATVSAALEPYKDRASIAAVNAPNVVTLSGESGAVAEILAALKSQRVRSQKLAVTQASHSPLVEPMLAELEAVASRVTYRAPQLAITSGLLGRAVGTSEIGNGRYWRRHNREAVQFQSAIQALYNDGYKVFVEIGPSPSLTALGGRSVPNNDALWLASLREGRDDWAQMLDNLSALVVAGVNPDWEGFDAPYPRQRIGTLPTYPFRRSRYWVETAPVQKVKQATWASINAAGERQSEQGPLNLAVDTYESKWDTLDLLSAIYEALALLEIGAFKQAGESHTVDGLIAQFGIADTYHHLMGRWLDHLVTWKMLRRDEGSETYTADQPLAVTDFDTAWSYAQSVLNDVPELSEYISRCGERLAAVITGKESPLETLFPGGDFRTVDFLYHHWPMARYFNGIARAVVEQVRPARVLEIGAGTGGTTASLLPSLSQTDISSYTFTDVSDFFLARAAERFAEYPFVRYGILNIEQNPQEQGYGSYDVIVAANVLHATTNLDETLQNARSLLAPGGVLVMYETTRHPHWFDITTGLIEGWQRFEDGWRGDNPLIAADKWREALAANGFIETAAFPPEHLATTIFGQHVIVGQAPFDAVGGQTIYDTDTQKRVPTNTDETVGAAEALVAQVREALPADRVDILVEFVRGHVRRVLRMDSATQLERRHKLLDLGFDSLMAVELRSRLSGGVGLEQPLPATLVFDYPTIEAIAEYLLRLLGLDETPMVDDRAQHVAPLQGQDEGGVDVAGMTDEEIEALLLKKFGDL